MPLRAAVLAAAALLMVPAAARAQQSPTSCTSVQIAITARCAGTIQAGFSLAPQMGMLLAGGDPAPEVRGGRAWLGAPLHGLSAGVTLRAVPYGSPDLTEEPGETADNPVRHDQKSTQPVLVADLAWSVLPLGGLGSVDLLGSVAVLGDGVAGGGVFESSSAVVSWGAGARLSTRAGVAASVMYRTLGEMGYGDVCVMDEAEYDAASGHVPGATVTACADPVVSDGGETRFELQALSGRLVATRAFGAAGILGGIGIDRFTSRDVQVASRGVTLADQRFLVYRYAPLDVEHQRLSLFLGGTYALPEGTFAGQVGYMGGGETVSPYPLDGAYDPNKGTVFGSVSFRFAL